MKGGIFRLPPCARRGQPETRVLVDADLQALGAFDGARPAPSDKHMRRQFNALLQSKVLARDRDVRHPEGFVRVLLGHVQGDSGPPLHRPGQTPDSCDFLDSPLRVLVRFSPFGRHEHPDWLIALTTATTRWHGS